MTTVKIALIFYSTYGHISRLAEDVKKGLESSGAHVDTFLFPETLSNDVLEKMHAAPKPDYPEFSDIAKLEEYDGYAFGFPTRYGRTPAQVSTFFDRTSSLWAAGALVNKFATIFTSSGTQHGGQETTALTTMPFMAHLGIIYVPIGFKNPELSDNSEIVGGSPYGAAAVAGGDGSREVSEKELKIAREQGSHFASTVSTYIKGVRNEEKTGTENKTEQNEGASTQATGNAGEANTTNAVTNEQKVPSKIKGLFFCCGSKSQQQNFQS